MVKRIDEALLRKLWYSSMSTAAICERMGHGRGALARAAVRIELKMNRKQNEVSKLHHEPSRANQD